MLYPCLSMLGVKLVIDYATIFTGSICLTFGDDRANWRQW